MPCQVDMLTVVQRVGNRKIQQAVRTVEVVQGNAVERIVERMRPMIQEQGHVVERIVERKRPMIQEVDMVTVVQRVRNRKVQQAVRIAEFVQEHVVERIAERKANDPRGSDPEKDLWGICVGQLQSREQQNKERGASRDGADVAWSATCITLDSLECCCGLECHPNSLECCRGLESHTFVEAAREFGLLWNAKTGFWWKPCPWRRKLAELPHSIIMVQF